MVIGVLVHFFMFLPYTGMASILVMWPGPFEKKLSFPFPMGDPHQIWLQSASRFLRKRPLKMLNLSDLGPRSMSNLGPRSVNDLDLWYSYRFMYSFSKLHLPTLDIIDYNSCIFWNIHCFTFFPYKNIRDHIWPCRKITHGQPRVIVWIKLRSHEQSFCATFRTPCSLRCQILVGL